MRRRIDISEKADPIIGVCTAALIHHAVRIQEIDISPCSSVRRKCLLTDLLHRRRHRNHRHRSTVEAKPRNRLQPFRKRQRFQILTLGKRPRTDAVQTVRKPDFFQPGAGFKRIIADGSESVRQIDRLHLRTVCKRPPSDHRDRIRQDRLFQRRTVHKCPGVNLCDRHALILRRDDRLMNGAAVRTDDCRVTVPDLVKDARLPRYDLARFQIGKEQVVFGGKVLRGAGEISVNHRVCGLRKHRFSENKVFRPEDDLFQFIAVSKNTAAEEFRFRRKFDRTQRGRKERFLSGLLQLRRQPDLCQGTVCKRIVSDLRDLIRYLHCSELIAIRTKALRDLRHARRERQAVYLRAAQHLGAAFRHGIRQRQRRQSRSHECPGADRTAALRNTDGPERKCKRKRIFADRAERGREHHRLQLRAAGTKAVRNLCDAVRDLQRTDSALGQRVASDLRQGSRQTEFRQGRAVECSAADPLHGIRQLHLFQAAVRKGIIPDFLQTGLKRAPTESEAAVKGMRLDFTHAARDQDLCGVNRIRIVARLRVPAVRKRIRRDDRDRHSADALRNVHGLRYADRLAADDHHAEAVKAILQPVRPAGSDLKRQTVPLREPLCRRVLLAADRQLQSALMQTVHDLTDARNADLTLRIQDRQRGEQVAVNGRVIALSLRCGKIIERDPLDRPRDGQAPLSGAGARQDAASVIFDAPDGIDLAEAFLLFRIRAADISGHPDRFFISEALPQDQTVTVVLQRIFICVRIAELSVGIDIRPRLIPVTGRCRRCRDRFIKRNCHHCGTP